MLDLSLPDQVLHGSRDLFDWYGVVDAVLIKEVDRVDPEPLERGLRDLLDVLRPAVEGRPSRTALRIGSEPELRRDDDASLEGFECLAHELFVRERPIDLGGVEERDAAFDGRPDQGNHLPLVGSRTEAEAHAHAAEPEGRDLEVAAPQFSLLHFVLLRPFSSGQNEDSGDYARRLDSKIGTRW